MLLHHTIHLLLLGVALVNSSPAWVYNTVLGDATSSKVDCSSFTKVYDASTGHLTYRCNNPSEKNRNSFSVLNDLLKDEDSDEDNYPSSEQYQSSGSSKTTKSKPVYQSITSGRSQTKKTYKPIRLTNTNMKPKRPINSRRNRCPPGQMFQSELDICIDYPLGPPLPPKRPNNNKQTMFDRMLGDAPVKVTSTPQKPANTNKNSKRPTNIRHNRCPPGQIFQSELDICIDYPLGPPLPPKQPNNNKQTMVDSMLGDDPVSVTSAHQKPKNTNKNSKRPNNIRRNRCPPGQMFQSELDICINNPLGPPLPPKRPINSRQTMNDRMLGDTLVRLTSAHQSSPAAGTVISVLKFNMKNGCKPNEIFVSELEICLPKNTN